MNAVEVRELRKSYDGLEAVRGISFAIGSGEVFGLLGPNGAGKTTTVEILEGYREPDAGEATVLGVDPRGAAAEWRERIGVVPQSGELFPNLTVQEHLDLFAGYYAEPRSPGEVLALVGLEDKRDSKARTLSGGQRRRLDLGIALIGDPELLFLDEPTTGFDPGARRAAWETIRSLRSLGKTILLTTHYIEEAQRLADRVAVLRQGEIVAAGTPAELTAAAPASRISFRRNGEEVVIETEEPTRVLHELTADAGGRLPLAHRGAGMRLLVHQFRAEQKMFWRSRELAFFTFLLPIVFFLILASAYGDEDIEGADGYLYLLAGMIGYGAAATTFAGLALLLVLRREAGLLKRLRATPLPAWAYIAAVLGSIVFVFFLEAVALVVLGRLAFDVPLPENAPSLVAALALGAVSFAALGIGLTAVIQSAEGSSAVVNAIYLPVAFISGSFFSADAFPAVLRAIAEALPLVHFIRLVRDVMVFGDRIWEHPTAVAMVAAWGIAGALVAFRGFRWEPRER
jgi:ABC-2 type transport system ATP-binding protein